MTINLQPMEALFLIVLIVVLAVLYLRQYLRKSSE